MASYSIGHATEADVPHILALIRELASYEKAASSNHATESTLLSTLRFAPTGSGWAQTLILRIPRESPSTTTIEIADGTSVEHSYACQDSDGYEVAGMALYFTNYSTWRAQPGIYLEDLYVRREFRGRGYGTALIRRLAAETLALKGGRLEWSCLRWNEPSLAFYRSLGAQEMTEWVGLRVEGEEELKRLAEGKK